MDKKGVHNLKYVNFYPKILRNKEKQKEIIEFQSITGTIPVQIRYGKQANRLYDIVEMCRKQMPTALTLTANSSK